MSSFTTVPSGQENTLDYRVYYKSGEKGVSPWHDIPLFANAEKTIFNCVIEIPRWSSAKMEIDTKSVGNPIKQDVKNGKLRYVKSPFPYTGYLWNYGAFPQTWEDPTHVDASTGAKGDNDPLDVCEIGQRICERGEVIQVKVLGLFALLDEGETDWKIICINVKDPLAPHMNDLEDVEKHMPGMLDATRDWFANYKINDGKPRNMFGFDGQPQNKEFSLKVIHETHGFWRNLCKTGHGDLAGPTSAEETMLVLRGVVPAVSAPAPLPEDVNRFWFEHRK